jgi:putative FmdB family regulatory protein
MSPIYEYKCPQCGFTETDLRDIEDRDNKFECRVCETDMKREAAAPRGDVKNPAAGPPRKKR